MSKLRIMSNNQWWSDKNKPAWEEQGLDCSAKTRAVGFARVFAETVPDIAGLQECSAVMADQHMQHFQKSGAGYTLLWGRDTPILYKTDKFELIDSAYMIYPQKIPDFEGEFNNLNTKSYCIAVLKSKEDGKLLIFGTTHLWYKSGNPESSSYQPGSDEARAYQLGLLMDKIDKFQAKYSCPAIIVGDLNARLGSMALNAAFDRGYLHARDLATDYADEGHGMHPCGQDGFGPYTPKTPESAIDHILVKNMPDGAIKRFERYAPDYYMALSDHLPLWIDIEI